MSTYQRLEARVGALERRQINTDTRIEEVTGEMTTGFKQISDQMLASFKQAADYDSQIEKQIDAQFDQVNARLDKIETTMLAMETRILDAFKQQLTTMNPQRPPSE